MPRLETSKFPVAFHRVTPVLRVNNLEASLNYYVQVLGFKMNWTDDDGNSFASVSRGDCHLFLSVGDQGNPGSWIWIGVSDVDGLHEEFIAKEQGCVIHPRTTLGARANCTLKTQTAMFFVSAQKTSLASLLEIGLICAAFVGGVGPKVVGRG